MFRRIPTDQRFPAGPVAVDRNGRRISEDNAGFLELGKRLMANLEIDEPNNTRKVAPHPSITRLLTNRELGLNRTPYSFGRNCLRSLILSDNRAYALSEVSMGAKGAFSVEGNIVVAHNSRKIMNVDISRTLCSLRIFGPKEKILCTFWIELPVNLEVVKFLSLVFFLMLKILHRFS
ncbi:unnamed protein product [Gongylonema pulchrum]|uniref:Uncharacterized protein n=1 Tax=Gongylonema pulchrum TaxID=637853 RepID=A0A183E7K0_9BILA|nr:unnamed protein product [Gongylonema pulchrum]